MTYLVGEPDMRWAVRFLDLLCCTVLLIFEQEDDSMHWFGQDGKCIVVDAKDLVDPEIANTDVFENCSEEGLFLSIITDLIQAQDDNSQVRTRFHTNQAMMLDLEWLAQQQKVNSEEYLCAFSS